jgi:hypothetical protein
LYTDVSESDLLRKRLITASTAEGSTGERERDAVNFAFIEARLVCCQCSLHRDDS